MKHRKNKFSFDIIIIFFFNLVIKYNTYVCINNNIDISNSYLNKRRFKKKVFFFFKELNDF